MEQKNVDKEVPEEIPEKTLEEEVPETNEIIICPNCNKEQVKIIMVSICEAKNSLWYRCSNSKKCPLFKKNEV